MEKPDPIRSLTGQRLADIATLTWDNVDLSRNEIRLKTLKTAKQLTIPIAAPLRTHLDSLAVGDEPGSPIHPRAFSTMRRQGKSGNLSNQFSDILAKAGLRQKTPHRSKHKGWGARRSFLRSEFSLAAAYRRQPPQRRWDSRSGGHGTDRP
jgi:integrase